MDKRKIGNVLGISSILTAVISIVFFFIERGPNSDIYLIIIVFIILAILGILFAIFSWKISRYHTFLIIGLIGNGLVLVAAFFLLLAMGISEP